MYRELKLDSHISKARYKCKESVTLAVNRIDGLYGLIIEPEAIVQLDKMLTQMTRDGTFTGSVLIAHEGNVLLSRGYGFADRARRIPNTPQTRFHLGSMTKTFTAMGILTLQLQGKLGVQDSICDFISDSPKEWQDITIHHLLTHTSGLSNQQSDRHYREIESATGGPVSPTEYAYYLGLTSQWSLDTRPGEQYAYNNFGYILLTYVIEQVSGQSYIDYLKQAIFTPLKMCNTGYQDGFSGVAEIYEDCNTLTGVQFGSPSIPEGSGHLYSTTEDLFQWDQALYTNKLLPWKDVDQIFDTFVLKTEFPGFGYGYGWFVGEFQGRPVSVSAGGGPAFLTLLLRYRQYHLTVIVLTNQGNIDPFSTWVALSSKLFRED